MAKAETTTHTKSTTAEVRDALLEARDSISMDLGRIKSVLRLLHIDGEDAEYVNADGSKRGGFKANHDDVMMLIYFCTDLLETSILDVEGTISQACKALKV